MRAEGGARRAALTAAPCPAQATWRRAATPRLRPAPPRAAPLRPAMRRMRWGNGGVTEGGAP